MTPAAFQIGGLDLGPVKQFAPGAGERDQPIDHDVTAVGELERVKGVLLDQKYGQSVLRVERFERIEDLPHDQRRKTKRRFVEQQEPRPAHQRARNRKHLLFAAGQGTAALREALRKMREQRQYTLEITAEFGGLGDDRAHLQVFQHRHAGKDAAPFGRVGELQARDAVRLQMRNVVTVEGDRAGPRARLAADGHHQSRFAGAVGADQRDDLAFVDVEIDAFERPDPAVERLDTADGKKRRRHEPISASAWASFSSSTPR